MRVIPLTQGKYALVDDEDYNWLSQWKWTASFNGCSWRAVRTECSAGRCKQILMHRQILNMPEGAITDHRDHNELNNQRSNLRYCTKSQNGQNQRKQKRPTSSRFKGVSLHRTAKKWRAYITKQGITHNLGFFQNEKDAACAYDSKAKELFGEFALTNF